MHEMTLYWQLGKWRDLVALYQQQDMSVCTHRTRLTVLASVGLCQLNRHEEARHCLVQALQWGARPAEVLALLASGVHNTLGLASLIRNQAERAHMHFRQAVSEQHDAAPGQATARARAQTDWLIESCPRLGYSVEMLREAAHYQPLDYSSDADRRSLAHAWQYWIKGEWGALVKVDKAMLDQHPDRAELISLAAAGYQQLEDVDNEQRCIQLALDWGIAKAWLKALLVSGIQNRMARAATLARRYEEASYYFSRAMEVRSMTHAPELNLALEERIKYQLADLEEGDIDQVRSALNLQY
ncbi:hypothetical protein [Billgrantia sp. C5P2]|uniref:hypothetical protein n=1 Tax=Billgrantia sp. C5P2 TaxID=3436239 RepID=UPI003DA60AA6